MRVLRIADRKIVVIENFHFYARMADRIMVKCLTVVKYYFTHVITNDFRIILSQEGLHVHRGAESASDDYYSLRTAEQDKEEKEDVEIDDEIT